MDLPISARNSRTLTTKDFAESWADWHRGVEERRRSPEGFLAVTGMSWLDGDPTSIADAPGRWWVHDGGPVVELAEDEHLTVAGEERHGRVALGAFDERSPLRVAYGSTQIEVARRGDTYIVRPRRADHPPLLGYEGTPFFAPSAQWALRATFLLHEPVTVDVGSSVDGLSRRYTSTGVVEFEVSGETCRLTTFEDGVGLTILFADATSGVSTYSGGRELDAQRPDDDGHVVVDFNRATNLPCAYTTFATCPLPPRENRLAVAIEAGERTPTHR